MRIARVHDSGTAVMALVDGDTLVAAEVGGQEFDDVPALLEACDGDLVRLNRGRSLGIVHAVALLPPVGRPRKIICVGLNYRAHAAESGQEPPPAPPLFAKWDNALVGPYDNVPLPSRSERIDWEAELAFLIGRRCRNVAADAAGSVLLGYTAANDVSARDYQMRTSQWTAGKAFDAFCPLGPWIVTVDEVGPNPDLAIRGRLDGELMQDSRTSDLIYSVPELVAFISSIMTLEPGDVVLTGTPSGVGTSKNPPQYIRPGQTYEVEIDGIGGVRNRFVAE